MNIRFIQGLLPIGAIALGSLLPLSQPTQAANPQIRVSCDMSSGIPVTTLHDINNNKRPYPFLRWHQDQLPQELDARQLCEDLSSHLENLYAKQGGEDISLAFHNRGNQTVICFDVNGNCHARLFALPTTSQHEIDQVLISLNSDPNFSGENQVIRGYNTTRVDIRFGHIWQMLW